MSTVVKDLGAVSAYAYAVEKGYTGTEAEFAELMADYAEVGQRAEDAADSALESKTAAQTAATTATTKASEATTAAQTATTKAAEAQADADAAALDASQALSAASTATTKATESTTAAATAVSAKDDAVSANTAAQSAKTAAQTAQTGAETAAASVQSSAEQIATNTEDIGQLKNTLSVVKNATTNIETEIGMYVAPSKCGTTQASESQQVILPVRLVAGHRYKYTVALGTASDTLCYFYVKNSSAETQSSILFEAGQTSKYNVFVSAIDDDAAYISANSSGKKLPYTVTIEDLTVDKTTKLEKLEATESKICESIDNQYFDITAIGYYRLNGTTVTPSDIGVAGDDYKHLAIDCTVGDQFTITGSSLGASARMYAFADTENNILEVADANATYNKKILRAPLKSAKLYVNNYNDTVNILKGFAISDEILNITSYRNLFNGTLEHRYINGNTISGLQDLARSYAFKMRSGYFYKATASGNNRFIVYGSSDGVTYTEITRIPNDQIQSHNELVWASGNYIYGVITIYYGSGASGTYDFALYENSVNDFDSFTVGGVEVCTAEQSDSLQTSLESYSDTLHGSKPHLLTTNIKFATNGMETPVNLCLSATKVIYSEGKTPNYEGFLYFDDSTQKFYYSNNTEDNPVYLFDWDSSLANNEHCRYWLATITADNDVIFLRDHQRQNPIIYPHTDYSNPYVVNFGTNKKPYGWLVGSSVVHFDDGSFVFGDYAYHSQTDEANNDRRIIWRVEKPYNVSTNWTQAHSFKHVYFTSNKSDEPDNEIGHIHAIMYDFYADDLYCTTGDIDRHCRMWVSTDHGVTWDAVSSAVGTTEDTTAQAEGQKWRMTNAVFTEEAIWWGTDAQAPYHLLWKCTRGENGHIDFSTLTEVCDLEIFGLAAPASQRTYITALSRTPKGLFIIDRGEPRGDKLQLTFYSFESQKLYIIGEFDRATTDAGELEDSTRIGLPMQCTTIYMPECMNAFVTGGGMIVRPNDTSLFNNSKSNYVGALKLELV